MKQIANIFMLAAVAAVALCSCSKAKNIDVSEDKVVFSIAGGEKSIDVTADGSYDIEGCPEWVTAEVGESVLTISVSENGTGAVRDCVIKLVGDNVSVPITITQADKCTHITVSETEVTIPKEGGRKELTIDTDGANIAVDNADFISPVQGEPCLEGRIEGDKLIITCPANDGGAKKGNLTLTCDDVTNTVVITIEGSICPTCNGTGKEKCTKCGGRGYFSDHGHHGGVDRGCASCGGGGSKSYDDGWADMSFTPSYQNHGFRKGSGQMPCPDCGGTGH